MNHFLEFEELNTRIAKKKRKKIIEKVGRKNICFEFDVEFKFPATLLLKTGTRLQSNVSRVFSFLSPALFTFVNFEIFKNAKNILIQDASCYLSLQAFLASSTNGQGKLTKDNPLLSFLAIKAL